MPQNCAVASCNNTWSEAASGVVSFHRFPKDSILCRTWIMRCRREDTFNVKAARICSCHFTDDCFERDLQSELMGTKPRRVLKPDAVPTRKLPTKMSPVKSPSRAMRAEKRKSRAMIEDLTTVRVHLLSNFVSVNPKEALA